MPSLIEISTGYARQLVKNFRDNKRLSGVIEKDEPTSIWFDANTILKVLGVEESCKNKDISGIRFYFGAYGTENDHNGREVNYEKLTLVMVQTSEDDPLIFNNEKYYKDNLTNPEEKPTYIRNKPAMEEANEGQFCPPPPIDNEEGFLMKGH
jgi:hypothetical protein